MNNEQNNEQAQPELPAMNWARIYVCPKGHFFDNTDKAMSPSVAWTHSFCQQCSIDQFGKAWSPHEVERVYYQRNEWRDGQHNLEQVAKSINERCLGKDAKCGVCNKIIPAKNDKAYHLQKHYSTAITEAEAHHIQAI